MPKTFRELLEDYQLAHDTLTDAEAIERCKRVYPEEWTEHMRLCLDEAEIENTGKASDPGLDDYYRSHRYSREQINRVLQQIERERAAAPRTMEAPRPAPAFAGPDTMEAPRPRRRPSPIRKVFG